MILNSLPTESLYKFCDVFGLSLIIFNTYYNMEMKSSSIEKTIILEGEIKKYEVDSDLNKNNQIKLIKKLNSNNAFLKKAIKELDSLKSIKKLDSNQLNFIHLKELKQIKDNREIDSLDKIIRVENRLLDHELIDIQTKNKLIENENSKISRYSIFLKIGILIGLILMIFGFYNWRKSEINI